MRRAVATSVDAYIARSPPKVRERLGALRRAIVKAAPGAAEGISYAIPAYRTAGGMLVYFAGHANHVAMYPRPRAKGDGADEVKLREEMERHALGKGTLRFGLEGRLPVGFIGRVVKALAREQAERMAAKAAKKKCA